MKAFRKTCVFDGKSNIYMIVLDLLIRYFIIELIFTHRIAMMLPCLPESFFS